MERKKRLLFMLTFVVSLVGVGLMAAALGTDYWIVARPVRVVDQNTIGGARNVTGGELNTKFQGYINFGLFRGYKELDHGLGVRKGYMYIADNAGLFTFGLWVAVLVLAALAIVWGLISMGFAIFNASTRPIETITGPMGLYLWNSFAMFCALGTFILFLVLYFVDLKKNVLSPEDREAFNWTSEDRAQLFFSFYFVVAASGLFLLNIIVVMLSGIECRPRYRANMNEKALDGVMMY